MKIPNKIEKKIKKIKNLFLALFLATTGWDRPINRKNLVPNSVHTRPEQENCKKNRKKKSKNLFPAFFIAKTGWDRPKKRKKHFSREFRSYSTRARKFQKKIAKILKKLENLFLAFFLSTTGWDRLRKREKTFSPKFRSYSAKARKFRKK